jgi:hypothetical protein
VYGGMYCRDTSVVISRYSGMIKRLEVFNCRSMIPIEFKL